jgi:hypothetical protein
MIDKRKCETKATTMLMMEISALQAQVVLYSSFIKIFQNVLSTQYLVPALVCKPKEALPI